jgi:hypothetical protein
MIISGIRPNVIDGCYRVVAAEVTPYLLLSGKNIDDLGYPEYCERNPKNRYSVVEGTVGVPSGSEYYMYLGFCFSSNCSTEELNNNASTHFPQHRVHRRLHPV